MTIVRLLKQMFQFPVWIIRQCRVVVRRNGAFGVLAGEDEESAWLIELGAHHGCPEHPARTGRQLKRVAGARKSRDLDYFPEPHRLMVNGIALLVQRADFHIRHPQAHFGLHDVLSHVCGATYGASASEAITGPARGSGSSLHSRAGPLPARSPEPFEGPPRVAAVLSRPSRRASSRRALVLPVGARPNRSPAAIPRGRRRIRLSLRPDALAVSSRPGAIRPRARAKALSRSQVFASRTAGLRAHGPSRSHNFAGPRL